MAWHVLKMRCHSGTGVVHNVSAPACSNLPRSIALPSHGFCCPAPQVGDYDSSAERAYNRSFAAKAERQEGDRTGGGWAMAGLGLGRPACYCLAVTPLIHALHKCHLWLQQQTIESNHVPCFWLFKHIHCCCNHCRCCLPPPFPGQAGKMKALAREVRGFSGRTRLPVYAASAICLRYDPGEGPAQLLLDLLGLAAGCPPMPMAACASGAGVPVSCSCRQSRVCCCWRRLPGCAHRLPQTASTGHPVAPRSCTRPPRFPHHPQTAWTRCGR